MLVRYTTAENGETKKIAGIYTKDEHHITRHDIDREALSVTRRLERAGYEAYVVGGAVRDLLLGKKPVDFDIATDARPERVRKLFRRSRIIGRRFRLVHVYIGGKTLEVSTFRNSGNSGSHDEFGTLSQDVGRRDFSMNALYYEPKTEYIIDHVNGIEDIRNERLRLLTSVDESFSEDPVRMVRAIRYASTTGFAIPNRLARGIRKHAFRLRECPVSRLTEELFKIVSCGASRAFFEAANDLGVLGFLVPEIDKLISVSSTKAELLRSLDELDEQIRSDQDVSKSEMIAAVASPFVDVDPKIDLDLDLYVKQLFRSIKDLVAPLTPPNADVERAARNLMKRKGLRPPRRSRRRRKPRKSS